MYQKSKVTLAVLACLQLTACGSSDDPKLSEGVVVDQTPVNTAPTIVFENSMTMEKENVQIIATVTDDGTISSYVWTQVSGPQVEISGENSASISFIAPNVSVNQDLVFELKVTDNDNSETSANVTVSVEQKLVNISVAGMVTDSPVANATVSVMVGEQAFEFTADDTGAYLASLSLDDDQINQMVSIVAQGVDTQQQVKLMSILGSVETLIAAAGDDTTVDSSENFAVNVTNLSTAQAVLVLRENLGQALASDQQLATLVASLDGEQLVFLAIAIKVAIDKAGENSALQLPAGFDDTLAMAMDAQASSQYVDLVRTTTEFGAAAQEMLADNNVTNGDLTQLDSAYYFVARGEFIEFFGEQSNSGQGALFNDSGVFDFDYELQDNQIILSFYEGGKTLPSESEQREIDGQIQWVNVESVVTSRTYTSISSASGIRTFRFADQGVKHFPDGEFSDENINTAVLTQALSSKSMQDFEISATESMRISLPLPTNFFSLNDMSVIKSDEFTFNPDGTGSTHILGKTFTWEYLEDEVELGKREMVLSFADNHTLWFTKLTSIEQNQSYAVLAEGETSSRAGIGLGGVIGANDKFDTSSVPGIYDYDLNNDPLDQVWWELWPNGNAYTVSTYDNNGDGVLAASEISVQYGDWSVDENGVLSISRWSIHDNPQSSGCFGDTGECYLYNERKWQILGRDENLLSVSNYNYFDFNNDGVFESVYIDNRKTYKVEQRPVLLTGNDYIPESGPQSLSNVLSPSDYFDQTWFGIDLFTLFSEGSSVFSWTLNQDLSFSKTDSDDQQTAGTTTVFADNSMVIEYADGSKDRFAYLLESNEVLLAAVGNDLRPYFNSNELATAYEDSVNANTVAVSMAELQDTEIFWLDDDSYAPGGINFIKFTSENEVIVYTNKSFSEALQTGSYKLLEDGSIEFSIDGDEGRMFNSLQTDDFNLIIRDQVTDDDADVNFLFTDFATAQHIVASLNNLEGE
jgi:hypothetical protein